MSKDQIRNILNIIFMIGAVVGVILYLQKNEQTHQLGLYIILISMVRANDEGQIGFLRDLRRMNVAITRARMKLIILGDASTMTRHPFYKKLYDYIEAL